MSRIHDRLLLASLLGLGSLLARPALAGSQTSTVEVLTSVSASCTIGTAFIVFAPYDPVNTHATIPDDQTGEIVIRCTKGTSGITIDLGNGAHNSGSQRRMTNAGSSATSLNYEIYKDTGRTSIWGSGDGGSLRSGSDLDGTGAVVSVTMYGRIPPAQLGATAGTYSDTLVSTVNF
jgi:spore coat protein U-like protein